jgi:uncharacterized protein
MIIHRMPQKQLSILNDNISILARNKSNNARDASQGQKYGPHTVSPNYYTSRTGALRGNWRTSTAINPTISGTEGPIRLNNPLLIAGFPGPGLVGSISTGFMIESLNMRQIACVESEYIMPGVIYVGGKLRHPFRLYANNKGTICVLVCETPILVQGIHRVLDAVMKWALDSKVTDVLVLEGIPMQGIPQSKRIPFILSNSEENHTLINRLDASDGNLKHSTKKRSQGKISYESLPRYRDTSDSIEPTYIGGISGGLLSSCISNNISCLALLVPSLSGIPDPEGAAIILETLARITRYDELRIDVTQLRQQGDQVKKNLEKITNSIRNQQRSIKENETGQGEGENLMYG